MAYLLRFSPVHMRQSRGSSHVEEAEERSPLELIRQKERELAQQLREAEHRAEQKIASARERAAEIQSGAESEARRAAEEFFRREMIAVQKGVAEIRTEGAVAAERIRRLGSERLNHAVDVIIDSLFPE